MASKLTKRRIDAANPGETLWDAELKGFGLRVTKGGTKSYVLKYRRGRVQRWLTIGKHGSPWTPETARKEAKKLIGRINEGDDPAAEKADARSAMTVGEFAERYLAEYAIIHKKASTVREESRALKNHILPALGRISMRDIQRADIAKFHRSLKDTPYGANRYLALLSHMFSIASDWGVRKESDNPCLRVKRYPEKARERFLSPEELRRLGGALNKSDQIGKNPYITAAIRLLLFTGARLNEILTLQWNHVDIEARLLRLPDSKTGEKTIALPAPAIEVLNELPRQNGNPYVICGKNQGAHLVNLQKPWRRIRSSAGLDDVRLHDLRHSFASIAASGGMSLPLIGSLLGHTQAQTTQRYAHMADDPRLAAVDEIGNKISAAMMGGSAEIVPFGQNTRKV